MAMVHREVIKEPLVRELNDTFDTPVLMEDLAWNVRDIAAYAH